MLSWSSLERNERVEGISAAEILANGCRPLILAANDPDENQNTILIRARLGQP
jgi:hypothetical protein